MVLNELRLGNYLSLQDPGIYIKCDFSQMQEIESGTDAYKPIPLTKQWALKLGFIDGKLEVTPFVNLHYYGDGKIVLMVEESYTVLTYIQNVHQVQNLYFSLTGQELNIKE